MSDKKGEAASFAENEGANASTVKNEGAEAATAENKGASKAENEVAEASTTEKEASNAQGPSSETSESSGLPHVISDEKRLDTKKSLEDNAFGDAGATYTIDDVVNAGGYGKFQKFLTFLAGLGWLADAFEIIILSIIGNMLACNWKMQKWQEAVMTSIVFVGMMMGAPIFGNFADRYGRRMSLAISMLLLFIFGAASAASPDYTWFVVLRGLMGFSLGGIAQGVTLCCEYYPAKVRGRAGFYLSYYWALGALGVVLSAWLIMAYLDNWRVFVFVASVPALIVFLSMKWYPESARYYLVSNQPAKAVKVLERLTEMNNSKMPTGNLIEIDVEQERGKISDLFKPEIRRTTLLFTYIWLSVAMTYYGIALVTPSIVREGSLLAASKEFGNRTFFEFFTTEMTCKKFSQDDFIELFWTSAAEFPGVEDPDHPTDNLEVLKAQTTRLTPEGYAASQLGGLLVFTFTVECCPRRVFLAVTCFLTAFLYLFLMLEMKPDIALLIVLFVIRGIIAGVFQLLFIMTTEAFPTTLRASAMGAGSGCARFGGAIIPFIAQVIVLAKPVVAIFILSIIIALAGIAAFLLPKDTRGKHMTESIAHI